MRVYDIVRKEQDLMHLRWNERANSSGTAGTYLKARTGEGTRALYYKLPRYNGIEFDGHECINELVAARLMTILGIVHLDYRLIHARIKLDGAEHVVWLNSSKNFRRRRERKMGLGTFVALYGESGESPYDVCRRYGWEREIQKMQLVDYLIINRDRHESNVEVIMGADGTPRLAPIFDNGLSFVASLAGDEEAIASFDPLKRVLTMNYIGSRSLEENLEAIAPVEGIHSLLLEDREALFAGLQDAVDTLLLNKMWDIIWARWNWYASL